MKEYCMISKMKQSYFEPKMIHTSIRNEKNKQNQEHKYTTCILNIFTVKGDINCN